jgi:hypothetical protein
MPVMTHLLRQTGINPYHSAYNPDALDDFQPWEGEKFQGFELPDDRYVILRVDAIRLGEVITASNEFLSPTDILEKLINSDGTCLEDAVHELSTEIVGEIE